MPGLNIIEIIAGILLCKVVNHSCPDTVDERVINMKPNSVYTRYVTYKSQLYSLTPLQA